MNYEDAARQQMLYAGWFLEQGQSVAARMAKDAFGNVPPSVAGGFIAQRLMLAEPYFVSAPICHLLEAGLSTFPDCAPTPDLLHTDMGFAWFERPLPLEGAFVDGEPAEPVRGIWWSGSRDRFLVSFFGTYAYSVADWPWNDSWQGWKPKGEAIDSGARIALGAERGYMMEFLTFIHQQILVARQARLTRAARRRMERDGFHHDPTVRIIELRRRVPRDHASEHEPVDWSCKWLVRGHWRNQWYPSEQRHRPRYVMAYVKGPEDKPLHVAAKPLYAVVR